MNQNYQILVNIIVPILLVVAVIILIKNFNTIFRKLSIKLLDVLGFILFLLPMVSYGLFIYLIITDLFSVYVIISSIIGDPFGVYDNYSTALVYSFITITIWHLLALIPAVQLYSIKTIISNQKLIQSKLENNR